MENFAICPKFEKCPIFKNEILQDSIVDLTYKKSYCLQGEEHFSNCKRFQFFEKYKVGAPESILPNSFLLLEDIAKRMGIID